jgi:microcystin-dependent protein
MPLNETERRRLHATAPAQLREATVLDPPLDEDGWLRVELDNLPGEAKSCPWMPRLDIEVSPEDAALVAQSDRGNYWVVEWWPQGDLQPHAVGGGSAWFAVNGEPSATLGDVGDFAINEANGDFYERTATGWQLRGSLRGPQGQTGQTGEAGPPNVLSMGSVTVGAPAASITGESPAQQLNLVLPPGTEGQQGIPGKSAYQVWLDAGNVGDVNAYLLSLKGAKGDKGDKGDTGDVGPTGYDTDRIGMVKTWTGRVVPDEYLIADGRQVAESDYPDLTAWAAAEVAAGNTTWAVTGIAPNRNVTLPDLTRRFVYGKNAADVLGTEGGEAAHALTEAELAPHVHGVPRINPAAFYAIGGAATGYAIGDSASGSAGSGVAHNNLPPYILLALIVKVRGVTVSGATLQGAIGPKGDAADPIELDTWHTVGNAATGLGTVYQAAAQYNGFQPVGFKKDLFGRVYFRGVLNGAIAAGVTVFTLPVGYRPPPAYTNGVLLDTIRDQVQGRFTVYPDGRVVADTAVTGWVSLDGLFFEADAAPTTMPVGPRGPAGPAGATAYNLPSARVATTGNIDLAAPGAQIDGVNLASGDLVLVWVQTNKAENGLYTWTAPGAALTRAAAAAVGVTLEAGTGVYVSEGTLLGRRYFFTTTRVTVGTALQFSPPRGVTIDEQAIDGLEGTYMTPTVGVVQNVTRNAAGLLFRVAYTPPVDCWWDVWAKAYVDQETAGYAYAQLQLTMNTADADGRTSEIEIQSGMHSGVVRYLTRRIHRKWKLAAGVAYTCTLQVYVSAAQPTIYRGTGYSQMNSEARVR